MGLTFKENCSDIRDSKSKEIFKILSKKKYKINIYDFWVDKNKYKNLSLINLTKYNYYDAILVTVKHDIFDKLG